jgi:hypothetical protein
LALWGWQGGQGLEPAQVWGDTATLHTLALGVSPRVCVET